MVIVAVIVAASSLVVSAAERSTVQPPYKEVKEMITEAALEYNIPPEVLKAIAYTESGYDQFKNGEPYISDDGGIGVMQITPDNIDITVDEERLKYDIAYNIEIGARVLDSKWDLSYLPQMNNDERNVLENWYFPIAAYNGLSKVNDPNLYPTTAYQVKVFKRISDSAFLYGPAFEFPTFDIRYEAGDETMKFPPGSAYTTEKKTLSQQMYRNGDLVYIDARDGAVNLRSIKDINSTIGTVSPYTPVKISGNQVESTSRANDFTYYPIKGITTNGYVSSAYLNKGNSEFTFTDPITDERAAALYFLASNGYVTGFQDGSFGSEKSLKREHVAVILDRILDMYMPSDYKLKATDVKPNNEYYDAIAKAEYNGYLGVGGKILPKNHLTRSQMASVLVRAFDEYYDEPTRNHTFKDQKSIENYDAVNKIYFNEVTVADPFRPYNDVTRSQFALFIYRTMVEQ